MKTTLLAQLSLRLEQFSAEVMNSDLALRLGMGLAIGLFGLWAAKLLSRALDRVLHRLEVELILRDFLRNISYAIGVMVTAVAALDALGVPTHSLLAVLGAAGLAVGLALKDSLSNIASGVMLIVLRPFHAGDFVEIAGLEGTVESVRVFQTVLRMPDNRTVFLPNSLITTAPIVNYTGRGQRRIDLPVGIGYEQDPEQARSVLLQLAKDHAQVLDDPAPDVLLVGLGDSSVQLLLRAWAPASDFVFVRSDLFQAVHQRFRQLGISIPFPQRDLNIVLPPGSALSTLLTKTGPDQATT